MNDHPLEFRVYGAPVPQGSKVSYGKGRLADSNHTTLRPWREAVKHAAIDAREGRMPLEGPLRVTAHFYLSRPKSAAKSVLRPWRKPDLDKLLRAAFDGMTDGGVWGDDAQVVDVTAHKLFAGHPGLDIPGMTVLVEQVT